MKSQTVIFKDLEALEYQKAWNLQELHLQQNIQIKSAIRDNHAVSNYVQIDEERSDSNKEAANTRLETINYVFFVEHPPVYTLGKSGRMENLLISESERIARGIQFFKTNRGGDITFHGPGQIVGYPILDLENFYTDIGRYLRNIEEVIILTVSEYGIKGQRSPGETGVWIDAGVKGMERKICAIGVRCSRWITMHGFALNVNTDLNYFNYIIPCGIQNKRVTSLQQELGRVISMNEVKGKIKRNFEKVFQVIMREDQTA